jgi:hypothetical protein
MENPLLKSLITRAPYLVELALIAAIMSGCYDSRGYSYPTDPGAQPSAVDIVFCANQVPAWMAAQDGNGAFKRVTPSVAGNLATVHLTLSETHAAFVKANEFESGLSTVAVYYGSAGELRIAGEEHPESCGVATRTVSGTFTGLGSNDVAIVSADRSSLDFVSQDDGPEYTLASVTLDPQELVATRERFNGGDLDLTGVIVRQALEIGTSGEIPDLKFNSAEVVLPLTQRVTLTGVGGATTVLSGFRTVHGTERFMARTSLSENGTVPIALLPDGLLATGGLQLVTATTPPVLNSNVVRSVTKYFAAPADQLLDFATVSAAPIVTSEASSGAFLRARFATEAAYDMLTTISYQQGSSLMSVSMTPSYAAGLGGYELTVPDLSGVEGFQSRWLLQAGTSVLWTSSRIGGSVPIGPSSVPRDGAVRRIASDAGFIIP